MSYSCIWKLMVWTLERFLSNLWNYERGPWAFVTQKETLCLGISDLGYEYYCERYTSTSKWRANYCSLIGNFRNLRPFFTTTTGMHSLQQLQVCSQSLQWHNLIRMSIMHVIITVLHCSRMQCDSDDKAGNVWGSLAVAYKQGIHLLICYSPLEDNFRHWGYCYSCRDGHRTFSQPLPRQAVSGRKRGLLRVPLEVQLCRDALVTRRVVDGFYLSTVRMNSVHFFRSAERRR